MFLYTEFVAVCVGQILEIHIAVYRSHVVQGVCVSKFLFLKWPQFSFIIIAEQLEKVQIHIIKNITIIKVK